MGPVRLFVNNHLLFFNGLCYAVGIAVINMEIQSNLRHTDLSAQFLGSCPGSGKVQFVSFRWKTPYENGLGRMLCVFCAKCICIFSRLYKVIQIGKECVSLELLPLLNNLTLFLLQ